MTTEQHAAPHAVNAFYSGLHSALDRLHETPLWSMTPDQVADALACAHAERARLAELELRLLTRADVDGVGDQVGAADVGAWWANTTRQTQRDVRRRTHLAKALEKRAVLAAGMAAGDVAEDQATVISRALAALPCDIGADVVERAEKELVRLAGHHDAIALTVLGKKILEVVAPDVVDAQLAKALADEERQASKTARLTMRDDGHGTTRGWFTLPTAHAAMLRKGVLAFAAPKSVRANGGTYDHELPLPDRMGQGFCRYIETYPLDRLPNAGGVSARVVVTMNLNDLMTDVNGTRAGNPDRPVTLDTGDLISAGLARRLACEAGIVPVVLDGASQPVDVGRAKRFHTPAQRVAIAIRDTTCTADGCDTPPGMCHVHHDHPWSLGGSTNVKDARLLCPKHHRMAHDPRYLMKTVKNGRVIFSRT